MKKATKRAISLFLAVLMVLSVLPVTAFAADEYPLMIYCDGVRVDENGDNPLRIKETEQKQLTVTYQGSETLPENTSIVWSSPTPYLVYVDQNGIITGRDSSKGAIMRVWVAENIESLWLIGPGIADSIYSWMDENNIDGMDTEGILDAMRFILEPIFGEDFTNGLCNSLQSTLDSMNVEIRATLVNNETGEEIAYNSTHVICEKSDALTAEFIPNGTYITNHEAVPSQVEVGYEMDMTGITTPLRLNMGVNWEVTEKGLLGIDVATDKATIDENGHIVFNAPGTVKITAKPDTKGLYDKLTALIEQMGGIANAGETIGWVLKEVFGLSVAGGVIDALVVVINGIVNAGTGDNAEKMKEIISKVSDWILGVTINDSVTVTILDQIDLESFTIYGDINKMSAFGGNRLLTITDIQPEGAIIEPEDVTWVSSNDQIATVDNGKVTARDGGSWGNDFTVSATIDGITNTINGSILGGNTFWPTDLAVSGPTNLNVGDTGTYDFTVYPSTLYDDGVAWDMNNIEVGLMVDGEIRYADNITDGVLYVEKGSEVDAGKSCSGQFTITAVGGGTTTLYVRTHSDSQRIGTGVSEPRIVKEIQVSVYQPVSAVTIDQGDAVTVEVGATLGVGSGSTQLTATVSPADATNKGVTWSSSNSSVKVDANGKVSYSGLLWNPVTATITATSQDNPALSDSVTVTFKQAVVHVSSVALNTSDVTLGGVGSTYKLTATVSPSDAENKNVMWSTSDPSVVAVAADGTLTAVAIGDAVVTVTTEDGNYTATCNVKVRADKTALQAVIDRVTKADLNEDDFDAKVWADFQAALNTANRINADEFATQQSVDDATKALTEAFAALNVSEPLTGVTIVPLNSADEKSGVVIYHKVPWYKTWTSQTVDLGYVLNDGNSDVQVAEVTWSYANWSVDSPEANIENPTDTSATIRPTWGASARSCWIQVTVTDVYGNTVTSDPVKVRFYNWDWQK